MKAKLIKILAKGCYTSFLTIELENKDRMTFYISREKYKKLKELGIPTSQSLRKREKNK